MTERSVFVTRDRVIYTHNGPELLRVKYVDIREHKQNEHVSDIVVVRFQWFVPTNTTLHST